LGGFSKKSSKKKAKSLEQELLDRQGGGGGGGGDGKDKVEINGQSFDLVETDELSEMDISEGDETPVRKFLSCLLGKALNEFI